MKPKDIRICLFGILLLSLIIRLIGIKWGLPNEEHFYPYYPDEYTVIMLLQRMEPEKLNFYPEYYPYGRIYPDPVSHFYFIGATYFLCSKLGIVTLTKDKKFYLSNVQEYAKLYLVGRWLSVIIGLLTIVVVYFIGKKIYSEATGLLSALFLGIAPLSVVYSKIMNVAVPVTFWLVLAMLCTIKLVKTGNMKWYILTGIAAGLAIGTKYTAFPFLLVIGVAHTLSEKRIVLNKKIALSYLTAVLSFAIVNPYFVLFFSEFIQGFLGRFISVALLQESKHGYLHPLLSLLPCALGLPLFLLSLSGIFLAIIRKTKHDLILLTWILSYYLINAHAGTNIIRYQNEQLPFLVLLASSFVFHDFKFFKKAGFTHCKTYFRIAIIAFVVGATLIRTEVCLSILTGTDPRTEASRWIIANIDGGTKIGIPQKPLEWSPPVINMQYYSTTRYKDKPIDEPKYDIINLNWSPKKLLQEKPEYLVFIGNEYEEVYKFHPQGKMFMETINNNYEMIKEFEIQPKFLGYEFKNKKYPAWILDHQKVLILKRIVEK